MVQIDGNFKTILSLRCFGGSLCALSLHICYRGLLWCGWLQLFLLWTPINFKILHKNNIRYLSQQREKHVPIQVRHRANHWEHKYFVKCSETLQSVVKFDEGPRRDEEFSAWTRTPTGAQSLFLFVSFFDKSKVCMIDEKQYASDRSRLLVTRLSLSLPPWLRPSHWFILMFCRQLIDMLTC